MCGHRYVDRRMPNTSISSDSPVELAYDMRSTDPSTENKDKAGWGPTGDPGMTHAVAPLECRKPMAAGSDTPEESKSMDAADVIVLCSSYTSTTSRRCLEDRAHWNQFRWGRRCKQMLLQTDCASSRISFHQLVSNSDADLWTTHLWSCVFPAVTSSLAPAKPTASGTPTAILTGPTFL
jgi:hypothetical protein